MALSNFFSSIPLLVVALGLCNLIISINTTILVVTLPTIAAQHNATPAQELWLNISIAACSAVVIPIFTLFSTSFGRKPILLSTVVLFVFGCILCGTASSVSWLIAGRSLQGVGKGGIRAVMYIIMADVLHLQRRSKYSTFDSMTRLIGTLTGPFVRAMFAKCLGLQWFFWIAITFLVLGALFVEALMPQTSSHKASIQSRLRTIDYVGCVLLFISLSGRYNLFLEECLHTSPILFGPYRPWLHGHIFSICSVQFGPALLNLQQLVRGHCILLGDGHYYGEHFGTLYYLPIFNLLVKGYSIPKSTAPLLSRGVISALVCTGVAYLISKTRHVKYFLVFGWALVVCGLGMVRMLNERTTVAVWVLLNLPSVLGLGCVFAASTIATQATAEDEWTRYPQEISNIRAVAAGLNPFFSALGQLFGILAGQTVFTNEMKKRVGPQLEPNTVNIAQEIVWQIIHPSVDFKVVENAVKAYLESARSSRQGHEFGGLPSNDPGDLWGLQYPGWFISARSPDPVLPQRTSEDESLHHKDSGVAFNAMPALPQPVLGGLFH
ncbi:MFS general substrate transporter [Tothia fuscella]|uniref:MFS general substrate transporter n=1 Tax=Tothia fuscella TaxID=1048955 RepID=A0A9P4TZE6_9PEZI|nr:MFS general substrate transporter [Tothia fuscella]